MPTKTVRLDLWTVGTDRDREPFPDGHRRWVWRLDLPGSPITCMYRYYKTRGSARAVALRYAKRWLRDDVRVVEDADHA